MFSTRQGQRTNIPPTPHMRSVNLPETPAARVSRQFADPSPWLRDPNWCVQPQHRQSISGPRQSPAPQHRRSTSIPRQPPTPQQHAPAQPQRQIPIQYQFPQLSGTPTPIPPHLQPSSQPRRSTSMSRPSQAPTRVRHETRIMTPAPTRSEPDPAIQQNAGRPRRSSTPIPPPKQPVGILKPFHVILKNSALRERKMKKREAEMLRNTKHVPGSHNNVFPIDLPDLAVNPDKASVAPQKDRGIIKPTAISLNWPLRVCHPDMLEPNPYSTGKKSKAKQGYTVWDVALDPDDRRAENVGYFKKDYGVMVKQERDDLYMAVSSHHLATKMRIYVPDLPAKWSPIVIEREGGIRCLDVYRAIYHKLKKPLKVEDYSEITPEDTERLHKQFRRRVDLLNGRRYFAGLEQKKEGTDWVLWLRDRARLPSDYFL